MINKSFEFKIDIDWGMCYPLTILFSKKYDT